MRGRLGTGPEGGAGRENAIAISKRVIGNRGSAFVMRAPCRKAFRWVYLLICRSEAKQSLNKQVALYMCLILGRVKRNSAILVWDKQASHCEDPD